MLILDATSFGGPSPTGIKQAQMRSLSDAPSSNIGLTVKIKEEKNSNYKK